MKDRKALSEAGLIAVLVASLLLCPLATGGSFGSKAISAGAAQFTFAPQVTPITT
jgi:hypothetical protein